MATIFYGRVSSVDQNWDHQVEQARAKGFVLDEILVDHGVSGVTYRLADRPEGRRLYDKLREGDTLVVRWLDRLGRSYDDVTAAVRHFIEKGVIIRTIVNDMTFDGSTNDPVQKAVRDALISFLAATAQAQIEASKSAQKSGIAAAKGDPRKYPGRKPSYDRATFDVVVDMIHSGRGVSAISQGTGLSRQTVLRIRDNRAGAMAALDRWGQ